MIRSIAYYSRRLIVGLLLLTPLCAATKSTPTAAWSMLTYIQADNDLAPYANYNISDMEAALAGNKKTADQMNLLVQWDQPNNNKTWRYRITPTGRIEDESVSQEMGINPAQEIIDSMKWIKRKYPAQHYALVLWNHGSGVEDYRLSFPQMPKSIRSRLGNSWLMPPGIFNEARGILYDDSQGTCLTNQGLLTALIGINQTISQKLDLLGMDACLMAMVEIAYQIKEYVNILVASEETEPGTGWAYSGFLSPLVEAPALFTPELLAQSMVTAYGKFYAPEDSDYSLSALNMNKIIDLKKNIDAVVTQITACKKLAAADTKDRVIKARKASQTFAIDSYVDLYSFYTELLKQCKKSSPKSAKILDRIANQKATATTRYKKSVSALSALLASGLGTINQIVFANAAGSGVPNAYGISIYYPNTRYSTTAIHPSYLKTKFAKESKWLAFIKEYRTGR